MRPGAPRPPPPRRRHSSGSSVLVLWFILITTRPVGGGGLSPLPWGLPSADLCTGMDHGCVQNGGPADRTPGRVPPVGWPHGVRRLDQRAPPLRSASPLGGSLRDGGGVSRVPSPDGRKGGRRGSADWVCFKPATIRYTLEIFGKKIKWTPLAWTEARLR